MSEVALACWLNIYDEVLPVASAGGRGGLAALTPVPAAALRGPHAWPGNRRRRGWAAAAGG